jgi:signal transduction histidine kinase
MKLFARYTRSILGASIILFLLSGTAFYYSIRYVQQEQIDSDLEIEEEEIALYIKKYGGLPAMMPVKDQQVNFAEQQAFFSDRGFKEVEVETNGRTTAFRQLIFGATAAGKNYKVTVAKSLEETDHLVQAVFGITAIIILVALLLLFLLNRVILKKLWQPFYETLDVVKKFSVNKKEMLEFPATETKEFNDMIDTLNLSTQQASRDYLSLKTFSENASHEVQTPLAIMRSKLDLLIQDEALTERQGSTLQIISDAIQRLSNLNSSLLLLAKIENRQYDRLDEIDLQQKIEEKMEAFNELWQMKKIQVKTHILPARIRMNSLLADILLNNLLSNATVHNTIRGEIFLELHPGKLIVSNTGVAGLDEQQLFNRFYKPAHTGEQNGLGLSIIKQICDSSGIAISYSWQEGLHEFRLSWDKPGRLS